MKPCCNLATIFVITLGVAVSGVAATKARAGSYTFTTFDAATQLGGSPGFTYASGINDSGQIVGYIGTPNNSDGFVFGSGSFTQIDVPNAVTQTTQISGINNSGQITGTYTDASGDGQATGFVTSGNAYSSSGSYTQLIAPFANEINSGVTSVGVTNGFSLNNTGGVVGGTTNGSDQHGFSYNTSNQQFTQIDVPGVLTFNGASTQAQGVNDAGHIVGWFFGADGQIHGFLDSGGSFVQLDAPFANVVSGGIVHGGVTYAYGINNSDTIVGYVDDGLGEIHGLVDDGGAYTEIDVPAGADSFGTDPFGTEVLRINSAGDLVGIFNDESGMHGFEATLVAAPEPASFAILSAGLVGLLVVNRRRTTRR